ncbi:hypothetical protein CR203_04450 [Salipaludibacillus neizhouensis]|uniref:DUF3307 domain-containing protein n=1 Tax=Salipaludibacillus neizhouensis TaxID=885475 RepID=A0A3A9KI81_9BACI|nr:DUF3307 domain-containing protein [Salipaludibacillus neizhouensis]RKL69283.1 hypothetical protein CR203_04450 [Salipaludibacillus neizhouensis]
MDNTILIFMLAHLICDFITQTDAIIKKKNNYDTSFLSNMGLIEHVIHHVVVTVVLLTVFNELTWITLLCLLIIAILHYVIDHFKSSYSEVIIGKSIHKHEFIDKLLGKRSIHFLTDQFMHIAIIYVVLFVFNKVAALPVIITKTFEVIMEDIPLSLTTSILLISILVVLLTFTSSVLIAELLQDLKQQKNTAKDEIASTLVKSDDDLFFQNHYAQLEKLNKNVSIERTWEKKDSSNGKESMTMEFQQFNEMDDNSAGKYIGILERLLIGLFIATGAYQGLIVIAALKTLTRFKQFEDKNFAEYYLIGTFLSILCALVIGLLIRSIWFTV